MSRPSLLDRARRDDGVTMIELLVAIVIFGILAGIAIPLYNNQRTRAQDATLKRDLHNVAKSVESWYADGNQNSNATDIGSGYLYMNSNGIAVWPGIAETMTPGFPTTKITPYTGIGARVINAQGGYCILGMRKGSSWQYGQAGVGADLSAILYYDSLLGGVKKRSELTVAGACMQFR